MTTEPVKMKESKVSDDKISKSSKKDKKDKKDKKKNKKEKKSKLSTTIEEPVAAEPEPILADEPNPSKKRKHSETNNATDEDENILEIDVTAPEPPSKKQLRKLKKLKDQGVDVDALTAANVDLTTAATKASNDKDDSSEKRSPYGVWIGNLAYDITTDDIREFLIRGTIRKTTGANDIVLTSTNTTNEDDEEKKDNNDNDNEEQQSSTGILSKDITRIKLPKDNKTKKNKGFAYVDFTKASCIQYAVLLSENWLGSRKVLIKASTDFKGRPDKPSTSTSTSTENGGVEEGKEGSAKKITKTVFVGNLPFETTEEQIREHFAPAGAIKKIRMATFEDTGKCKGYAWVDYEKLEGAVEVISGWTKRASNDDDGDCDGDGEEADGKKNKKQNKKKKANFNPYLFLEGRKLRMEYGEDSTVRYKKRFGKKKDEKRAEETGDFIPFDTGADYVPLGSNSNARERRHEKRGGGGGSRKGGDWKEKKRDARLTKPGAALAKAQRATVGIVESEGKKITFD